MGTGSWTGRGGGFSKDAVQQDLKGAGDRTGGCEIHAPQGVGIQHRVNRPQEQLDHEGWVK